MRLVHDHQRDAQAVDFLEEAFVGKAFGRDVEQAELAGAQGGVGGAVFVGGERRVHAGGGDAVRDEKVELVFHERDERRDDDRQPFEEQRGELVAKRLARAGGKNGEDGMAAMSRRMTSSCPWRNSENPEVSRSVAWSAASPAAGETREGFSSLMMGNGFSGNARKSVFETQGRETTVEKWLFPFSLGEGGERREAGGGRRVRGGGGGR